MGDITLIRLAESLAIIPDIIAIYIIILLFNFMLVKINLFSL